jgi:uncharacterized protein YggE
MNYFRFDLMKTITLIAFLLLSGGHVTSQVQQDMVTPRTVTVTGTATVMAEPDRIRVNVDITDQFCASPGQNINSLTDDMEKALKAAGMTMKDARLVAETTSDLGYMTASKSTTMITRHYEVIIGSVRQYRSFVQQLPTGGITTVITSVETSSMAARQLEVQQAAIADAHAKAVNLLKAAGAEIGQVMSISENPDMGYGYFTPAGEEADPETPLNTGIPVRFSVTVSYFIK